MVHIGETPAWIEEAKRQMEETGVNPFEGAHCFEFRLPNGTIIRAACEKCGTPAAVIRPERRRGERRRG